MNDRDYSLEDIDQMSMSECQGLPFEVRDRLLGLVIEGSRKYFGKQPERQVGYDTQDAEALFSIRQKAPGPAQPVRLSEP